MSQDHWVITVTHERNRHGANCAGMSRPWPQVIEQPIDYVAPGIALPPASDYLCTACGWALRLVSRTAVGTDVDQAVDRPRL